MQATGINVFVQTWQASDSVAEVVARLRKCELGYFTADFVRRFADAVRAAGHPVKYLPDGPAAKPAQVVDVPPEAAVERQTGSHAALSRTNDPRFASWFLEESWAFKPGSNG